MTRSDDTKNESNQRGKTKATVVAVTVMTTTMMRKCSKHKMKQVHATVAESQGMWHQIVLKERLEKRVIGVCVCKAASAH